MKLEETENLILQYVKNIQTTTTHINNIHNSDTDLSKKITEILNIFEKNASFKGKPSIKKWCKHCRRYGDSIAECRQKEQDNQNKPQKYKEPNKSFYQYMKNDQNLPNKIFHSNNSSKNHFQIAQTIQKINRLIILTKEVDHQTKEVHKIPHKTDIVDHAVEILNMEIFVYNQTPTDQNIRLIPVPIHNLGIDTVQMIDQETHRTIDTEIIPIIETEAIQINEINDILINHEIIQTTNQIT